ncbi:hypothetical protein LR004_01575 [Candidatus Gracilibacteria bacterium]|nr:hypothetical protein [Candidatus Gracilibacteria bacterium]
MPTNNLSSDKEYKYLIQEGTQVITENGQIIALKEDNIITFPQRVSAIIEKYDLENDEGETTVPVTFDIIGLVLIDVNALLTEQ